MNTIRVKSKSLLLLAALTTSSSAVNFLTPGADLDVAANWEGGAFPQSGEQGLVEINAAWPNTSGGGTLSVFGDLIIGSTTATNITLTAAVDIVGANPSSVVFNNVTVNVMDDIFTGGGTGNFIFNPGSVTTVADDFEANGGGTITINGGTHSLAGTVNTSNVGAQNNSTLNFLGGTVTTDVFRTQQNGLGTVFGTINLGGDATITSDSIDFASAGIVDVSSDWTGSITATNTLTDFEDIFVDLVLLDGTVLDATAFDENFQISEDGLTLSLIPEPSAALLGMMGILTLLRRRRL